MLTAVKNKIKGTPLAPPAKFLKDRVGFLGDYVRSGQFVVKNRFLKREKNIFYTITPPESLDNIGDHAQVIGIKKWFDQYFSEYRVVELDKNQTTRYIPALRYLIDDDDLIFLHSGGNLNDRSLWSEGARREVVQKFNQSPVIQLPQTVFFSDSKRGRRELENSKEVYDSHEDLTIVARDPVSHDYVQDYFDVKHDVYPDFALMIDADDYVEMDKSRSGVMLCLRRDEESDVSSKAKDKLTRAIRDADYEVTHFDTTLDEPIPKDQREMFLADTLNKFADHDLVITDRFHGMIFSVITRTPCIAIDTVDHKISSSSQWFSMYENEVQYVDEINAVPPLIEQTAEKDLDKFDWREEYFSELANSVRESYIR